MICFALEGERGGGGGGSVVCGAMWVWLVVFHCIEDWFKGWVKCE